MLKNILILWSFSCAVAQMVPTKKPILLKLTPEQIRNTFDNIMSDDYIGVLAKEFATKAAEHFVKQMNHQKDAIVGKIYDRYKTPEPDFTSSNLKKNVNELEPKIQLHRQTKSNSKGRLQLERELQEKLHESNEVRPQPQSNTNQNNNEDLLDSREALNLLRAPEPDGDHLDSHSKELFSGEVIRDKIPVIEVMKINGAYFRRILGLI